jgi:hypothetical protein
MQHFSAVRSTNFVLGSATFVRASLVLALTAFSLIWELEVFLGA